MFADGSSVRPPRTRPGRQALFGAHRFGRSAAYSLGIEEALQILARDGYGLVSKVDEALAELRPNVGDHMKRELYQSVVEISTGSLDRSNGPAAS